MQHAVGRGFHAAGAAGLLRAQRGVQPDIDTLNQAPGDGHIVIFQEDDAPAQIGSASYVDNPLDQLFAAVVERMRLAGKDNLHGVLGAGENPLQSVHVAQQQRGALVGGKAPRKADCQGARVQQISGRVDTLRAFAMAQELAFGAAAHKLDQVVLTHLMGGPQFLVGDIVDGLPGRRIFDML